ncbi:hypothetical protein QUB80_06265 [Chlorogloeopsis sp. ULAP01]|uniref:hypothetical protein n=1 Tax=Chlorogloeopsis sp. ULAP01 TaxID=3056483 RepID=UPI0025AAA870|nr:hypothetical protein [Chlorogloeopsis sp. ULAP01]MDM9380304.1 hypothetical protein [Chlorogloeopsis sp. ULAP01]
MTREKFIPDSNFIEKIQIEMIGKLAVGNYVIQVGSSYGAIANAATIQKQPILPQNSTPALIRHPPYKQRLEYQDLLQEALAALQSRQSVEFCTPIGFDQTELLLYLAHKLQASSSFVDGVIYLSPIHPYVDDFLQSIWEVFYQSHIPYKPTNKQIRQQIQNKSALIVLNENNLTTEEVTELRNALSKCTFVFASSKKHLHKQGRSIELSGLSIQDALVLVEEELQSSLTIEERPAAISLCKIMQGHPIYLRLAIAYMLEDGRSLVDIVSQLPTSEPEKYLIQQILESLTGRQRSILDLLAVMGDAGLSAEQIIAITQQPKTPNMLENLCRLHLLRHQENRYTLNKIIAEVLPPAWKLKAVLESVITYFTNWAQKYYRQPKILGTEIDAITQVIEVAVKASRWQDVLRLVKVIESSLALNKQWSLWEQVLQRGLQASQARGDRASEAWILHQLGTRTLCLEENAVAADYLTKALEIRLSLSDKTAATATRHNLNFLSSNVSTLPPQNFQNSSADTNSNHNQQVRKDTNSQSSTLPPALTRMSIVTKNTSPVGKPHNANFLLSPKRMIATGILASGGLLILFNWHRFTPSPTKPSTSEPKATIKPAPITKPTSRATQTPSVITQPTSVPTATLSPLPENTPIIDPVISPVFPEPVTGRNQNSNTEGKSAPQPTSSPTPTSTPTPEATPLSIPTPTPETTPTPTPISPPLFESPTPETLPIPTFTPTPEPSTSQIPSSSIITPLPTATAIPKAEITSPNLDVTVPTQELFNQPPTPKSETKFSIPDVTVTTIEEPLNQQ